MFWEKKEGKKELPELPPLKIPLFSRIQMPEEKAEEQAKENGVMKEYLETVELPEISSKFSAPKVKELGEMPMRKVMPMESSAAKTEDVYVKIDRFHSARKALNSAREKLKDIDEFMKKIRETRMREEQELSSWEEEIESIKSKVENVTRNIFEKVE